MIIWGKVIGAVIGFIIYGPVGVVLGLVFGQIFDNGLKTIMYAPGHSLDARAVFFRTVFQIMGYMAKANGIVSENEIKVARGIMLHDFKLNAAQMLLAIQYFNEGKQPGFNFVDALNKFKLSCGRYIDLRRFFLELQVKAAMADGILREEERGRLVFICTRLNLPLTELDYLLQTHGYSYYQQQYQQQYQQNYSQSNSYPKQEDELSAAYKLLGVTKTDNTKTVKNAYRRLMSKYHPDKLVAKGLPPEMMTVAKEKTQQITVAYDLIMRSRE